jgi:hypothetical protein
MIFVTPQKARVIDPQTRQPLPAEGRRVPDSSYWRRRARDGDVIIGEPKQETKKQKKVQEG